MLEFQNRGKETEYDNSVPSPHRLFISSGTDTDQDTGGGITILGLKISLHKSATSENEKYKDDVTYTPL